MRNEIKEGLLEITPDLKESKDRIRRAVLKPEISSKKSFIFPRIIFSFALILSIVLITSEFKTDSYVNGFSQETLNMYSLLEDSEPNEQYQKDLIILKYGELENIQLKKQDVKNLVTSYRNELPASFERVLKQNKISESAYKAQYLTLKAQVQLVFDSLLPKYTQLYPQFPQEVHAQLIILDAMEKVEHESFSFGNKDSISAIVLYEGENARVLSLIEEKKLAEEQFIIMPKHDSLNLKIGDAILLENNLITSQQAKDSYKQFVVSEKVRVIKDNEPIEVSVLPKKINEYFEQSEWTPLSITDEPDMRLKTLEGNYFVWFHDNIIIGSNSKGVVIDNGEIQSWGENMINN